MKVVEDNSNLQKNFETHITTLKKQKNILKFFLRWGQNHRFEGDQTFFLTLRKSKNPRSKKFRYIGFMETFNI